MMKKIIFGLIAIFVCASTLAQTRQKIPAYGFDWNRGGFVVSFTPPRDTAALPVADSGSMSWVGGRPWFWTGYFWDSLRTSGISEVDSLIYTTWAHVQKQIDSVATLAGVVYSAGYGLGVTANTFRVDSAFIATRLRVQKQIDSVAALAGVVYSAGYGVIKVANTFSADTSAVTSRLWHQKGMDSLGLVKGDVSGPGGSANNQMAIFNGTTGRLIQTYLSTGLVKTTLGVPSIAAAGTDYLQPNGDGTQLTGITYSNGVTRTVNAVKADTVLLSTQALLHKFSDSAKLVWLHGPMTAGFVPVSTAGVTVQNSIINAGASIVTIGGRLDLSSASNPSYFSWGTTGGTTTAAMGGEKNLFGAPYGEFATAFYQFTDTGHFRFKIGTKDAFMMHQGAFSGHVGTATDRPSSPSAGDMYYDTDSLAYNYYNGSIWQKFGGTGGGGGGGGGVSSVGTGFGMLGGPITTTGTVRADSAAILTFARGKKMIDSLGAIIAAVDPLCSAIEDSCDASVAQLRFTSSSNGLSSYIRHTQDFAGSGPTLELNSDGSSLTLNHAALVINRPISFVNTTNPFAMIFANNIIAQGQPIFLGAIVPTGNPDFQDAVIFEQDFQSSSGKAIGTYYKYANISTDSTIAIHASDNGLAFANPATAWLIHSELNVKSWHRGAFFIGPKARAGQYALTVDGRIGFNKDSIPISANGGANYAMLLDTSTNQIKRVNSSSLGIDTATYLPNMRAYADSVSAIPDTGVFRNSGSSGFRIIHSSVGSDTLFAKRVILGYGLSGTLSGTKPSDSTLTITWVGNGTGTPTVNTFGTNVTSVSVAGNDNDFTLTVTTSAAVNGSVCNILFANVWPTVPIVGSPGFGADATTMAATTKTRANGTSTTTASFGATITAAGTYIYNFHAGKR